MHPPQQIGFVGFVGLALKVYAFYFGVNGIDPLIAHEN
jgi:hypothetical protein